MRLARVRYGEKTEPGVEIRIGKGTLSRGSAVHSQGELRYNGTPDCASDGSQMRRREQKPVAPEIEHVDDELRERRW